MTNTRFFACLTLGVASLTAAIAAAPPAPSPATPPRLEFAFSELVTLAADITPGTTAYGARNIVPITGGTFSGPNIHGTIIPGGWDWQLRRADGCLLIKADYMLRTDDGVVINIVNQGPLCPPAPGSSLEGRTIPVFEAPLGKYDWLTRQSFVGTLTPTKAPDGGPAVRIGIYRVR